MITELLRRLTGTHSSERLDPEDARLAFAALMVRLARSDDRYSPIERARIDLALGYRFGIDAAGAAALRLEAESAEELAPDTVRFTRLIKEAVPYEEREAVIEALWRVAASDGINEDEHGFLRLVANLIGVSDKDSGLARQRVLSAK